MKVTIVHNHAGRIWGYFKFNTSEVYSGGQINLYIQLLRGGELSADIIIIIIIIIKLDILLLSISYVTLQYNTCFNVPRDLYYPSGS